jgi:nitric oxide reductase subunit B
LWVEGFFEVFATAVIALLFTRLGLIHAATANSAIILETIVFLFGSILGACIICISLAHRLCDRHRCHVLSTGSGPSMIGVEAYRNYQRSSSVGAVLQWSILCFIAVGFWNTVGAGLLGFSINTPIALYYMQGLKALTAAHGRRCLVSMACWASACCCSACVACLHALHGLTIACWRPCSGCSISVWQ